MPPVADLLPWSTPALHFCGALAAAILPNSAWRSVAIATRLALASAVLLLVMQHGGSPAPIVSALIAFLGWIIGDYAHRYLRGEPGQDRFAIAYLFTLAAVGSVVASTNLLVLIAAWSASSVGLHHLLTFYRDRPAAVLVAHKKFLTSRLAEVLLVGAAILLYREWGTFDLTTLAERATSTPSLPWQAAIAALLIAAAVALKSAQLPFHGWLIQVMEAPTPVSALLHAGVVNLGGFVLIRLAPLISASSGAQALLVVLGGLTAVVAGLVMLTRITIKVRLAWSTCSQMGLMLVECGLGLYDLALLHLVAHALYKAHAFLGAGSAVQHALQRAALARSTQGKDEASLLSVLLALPAAWAITSGSAYLWHSALGLAAVPWTATTLLAVGLATLLWAPTRQGIISAKGLLGVVGAAQLYLAWHTLLANSVSAAATQASPRLEALAVALFLALYAAQSCIWLARHRQTSSRLYDWIYAGLYLDERFTRLTFLLWPPDIDTARNRRP